MESVIAKVRAGTRIVILARARRRWNHIFPYYKQGEDAVEFAGNEGQGDLTALGVLGQGAGRDGGPPGIP